ncbi:MAG TPA: DUF819 family protein [Bacteroidales bacterium]|jgi:uncharacterized membrane protein|nr:DUF819 family protein [Bacteroidales bacterium]OQC57043.1 MAG: hypothetical protein BWX52_01283 [Bacteroidetes bacterium ADurb.Bin013]NLZ09223.1 DUF819 family protein [Bacteroidales bacterium]HNR27915.1 DUF819 family protein [Bacteroidales bacterium]HNT48329.1 DUF819 family protein [Bacteroidales bacterium]
MRNYLIAFIYIAAPVFIMYLFQNFRFFSKIGTVMMAYAIGIIMSLSGMMKGGSAEEIGQLGNIQGWFMNLAVPIAIPLILFSSHFTLWFKTMKKTFTTLIAGIIAIFTTIVIAYLLFRKTNIPEVGNVCSMLVSMYTGGTMNFASLQRILGVQEETYILVQTFDTALSFFLLMFVISVGYKIFRKILPYGNATQVASAVPENEIPSLVKENFEDYSGMFKNKVAGKLLVALSLSIACLGIGAGISMLAVGGLNDLIVILTITTLALLASFWKKIREIPKTFEFGMYFILVFSIVIASQFNIRTLFMRESLNVLALVSFILVVSIFLHLILARIFRVEGDLFTVSHIALLFSPPFVPPVASAMNNRRVLVNGIIIGLLGYTCGTYLGTIMAGLFKWIG